ncbi:hypothetical protein RRU94_21175 [Domibacillus sp. DTU_2020_1001157_1_SI_ALB_TIR_016]|uniref:hypothetical protein n=1 Tax=Domibacillus sp. DTU_2020_1001157_1_SI_ALB_TIR_016 TaxID=3077789 RepID=UPI0028E3CE2C|nr:hypothetical protein [Domibacillus sp. DTU_2020_1001157_1_SI_ALB_TIR_016]WNS80020.1 hypothetical protein RRU94_21175 [Domibacillus sp. DTU_2020_1001157_1_SI_ALB_TIR_016]
MDFLIEIRAASFETKEQVESRLRYSTVQLFVKNDIALASSIGDAALFEKRYGSFHQIFSICLVD